MELTEDELLIVNEAKMHLTRFLKDQGGFYPFGHVIESDRQTRSIAASDGREHPGAQDLIDILEKSFTIDIKDGKCILAVICIDVFIHNNIDGVATKQDAIEMRFISPTYRKNVHLIYELDSDNNVTFKDFWLGNVGSDN